MKKDIKWSIGQFLSLEHMIELKPNIRRSLSYYKNYMDKVKTGDLEQQIIELDRATNEDITNPLFHYCKGLTYAQLGRYEHAFEAYQQAERNKLNIAALHNSKAIALLELGRTDEAIDSFNTAIELEPDDADFYDNKYIALEKLGRTSEALQAIMHATKMSPTADRYFKQAMLHDLLGKHDAATGAYARATELNPQDKTILHYAFLSHYDKGDYHEATQIVERMIELEPQDGTAYYNKAKCAEQLGEVQQAIECYNKAIDLDPANVSAHYNIGLCFAQLGDAKQAIECYDNVIKLDSNHIEALYNKASCLSITGATQKANEYYGMVKDLEHSLGKNIQPQIKTSYIKCPSDEINTQWQDQNEDVNSHGHEQFNIKKGDNNVIRKTIKAKQGAVLLGHQDSEEDWEDVSFENEKDVVEQIKSSKTIKKKARNKEAAEKETTEAIQNEKKGEYGKKVLAIYAVEYDNPLLNKHEVLKAFGEKHGSVKLGQLITLTSAIIDHQFT